MFEGSIDSCRFDRIRGSGALVVVPLPATTEILDQRHRARRQRGLRIFEVLRGLQKDELLGKESLLTDCTHRVLGILTVEQ